MRLFRKIIKGNLPLQVYSLMFIGLLLLFSASKGTVTNFEGIFIKQAIWILLGSIMLVFVRKVDYRHYSKLSILFYFLTLFFLVLVLVFGHGRASRWIKIGFLNFQPAEFAKIVLIIMLSSYLKLRDPRKITVFFASLLLVAVPFFLILKQPNLGTAGILLLTSLGVLLKAGFPKKKFVILFSIAMCLSPFFWFSLKGYQKGRILTLLNPGRDPLGKGYNILQSKITIGSGGLLGKGFLQSTQTKLAFLPEYHTDFIFCLLAEEFGFAGVLILLVLYYLFLSTIISIIATTKDRFAKMLASGILVMFFSQIFINIGMSMGILPVAGIPLPFLSYGGSSIILFLIATGILMNIKENTTMF